jgi:hypothetical protein
MTPLNVVEIYISFSAELAAIFLRTEDLWEFTNSLEENPAFIYWVEDFPTLNTEAAISPESRKISTTLHNVTSHKTIAFISALHCNYTIQGHWSIQEIPGSGKRCGLLTGSWFISESFHLKFVQLLLMVVLLLYDNIWESKSHPASHSDEFCLETLLTDWVI